VAVFTLALDHPPGERTPQNDDFHIHKAATLPDSVYRLLVPVLDARFSVFYSTPHSVNARTSVPTTSATHWDDNVLHPTLAWPLIR